MTETMTMKQKGSFANDDDDDQPGSSVDIDINQSSDIPSSSRKTKKKTTKTRRKKKKKSESTSAYLASLGPGVLLFLSTLVVYFVCFVGFLTLRQPDVAPLEPSSSTISPVARQTFDMFHKKQNHVDKKEEKKKQSSSSDKSHRSDDFYIPPTKWPVSIRDEEDSFEEMVHPGDNKTVLPVPKFWSPPLNNGQLMSADMAARVGSYVNGKTDMDAAHKGNPDDRTIFVAIASYRDWQCRYTVESILRNAKFPERVRVAVVDQISDGDASCAAPIKPCAAHPNQGLCRYIDNVDVIELDAMLAIGPVFARHLGHRLYRGEYYVMQVDAHVDFVKHWDVDIILQMEASKNEMAVLSTYLTDIEGSIDPVTGLSLRNTRPIMCWTDYENGGGGRHLRHMQQPEREPPIKGLPQLQPFWAAGFSFARGHFVVNIPYDQYQPMIFQGEEISVGIRGFTYGYDFYAPERSICFHAYAIGKNAQKRGKVKHFWEHANLYAGVDKRAMKRLIGIIQGNPEVDPSEWDHTEEEKYGIGKVRKPSKFYETIGIDVVKKTAEQNLCSFVQPGKMHNKFIKYLRDDGMGIDYSKIDYKFVNPAKKK